MSVTVTEGETPSLIRDGSPNQAAGADRVRLIGQDNAVTAARWGDGTEGALLSTTSAPNMPSRCTNLRRPRAGSGQWEARLGASNIDLPRTATPAGRLISCHS